MRLTAEKLRRYAEKFVSQQRRDLRLLAVYLSGSLLRGQPFLGGAADVDLVLIYNGAPDPSRESLPLPGEAHLDIRRHDRSRYEPARNLRTEPFLGPTLFRAEALYDPQHFLDFAQAAVRSRFRAPESAAARARALTQAAREAWFALDDDLTPPALATYLEALFHAANAPATLLGYTFSRRRLLLDFPLAAQHWGYPQLTGLLFQALGAPQASIETLQAALPAWHAALAAAARLSPSPAELAPPRQPYYRRAVEAYLASSTPANALYPLLFTWTLAVQHVEEAHLPPWQQFVETVGLAVSRREALDTYLDTLEEALETWAQQRGVG